MFIKNKFNISTINGIIILFLYLFSLNLMALGINMYIKADIGIGSWDVLHNNLTQFYGLTFGTWVSIVGAITILISQLFYLNFKTILAIFTGVIFGKIIDLWLDNIFTFEIDNLILQIMLFFLGVIFIGSGISLLVLTKLPPTPPDVLMVSLMKRFKLNFLMSKTIIETFVFIVAVIIGSINKVPFNNLGVGTIISLIFIGPIVELSSKLWKRILYLIDIFRKIIYTL